MVLVNAADYDDVEMEELLSERCSEFGLVTDVEIRRDLDPFHCDVAIIGMSTEDEANEVVKEVGGMGCGSAVLIAIVHQGKRIPAPQTLH